MSTREHGEDELSLFGDSDVDKSFSGFSTLSEDDRPKVKSKVVKKTAKKAPTKKKNSTKTPSSNKAKEKETTCFDLSKMTNSDIDNLRGLLGIHDPVEQFRATPVSELPNLHVEVDSSDIVIDEMGPYDVQENVNEGLNAALFAEELDDWGLPKLKVPEKGKAVSHSLANMINVACTSQCDVDNLMKTYKVPVNCDKAGPPNVNPEIWKVMDRRAQSLDRGLVEIQNLLAASMTPIIKLADVLKNHIVANGEAKSLLSDALTLLGQAQYGMSVKRRYSIRPTLKRKYYSLCSMSMPITNLLFGDDISRDIKACDSLQSIGREQSFRPPAYRGRGLIYGRGYPRRGYSSQNQRYQPYPCRGQPRGSSGLRNYHIPRRAPSPNDKA